MSGASFAEPLNVQQIKINDYMNKAVKHFEDGQYGPAIELLKKILSLEPSNRAASNYLLSAEQKFVEPYCNQALDEYLSGDYEKAISHWQNVLRLNPNDNRASELINMTKNRAQDDTIDRLFFAAEQFFNDKLYKASIGELKKILLLDSNNVRARELLSSITTIMTDTILKELYEKADMLLKRKEYDLAIAEWKKVLDIDSKQETASRSIAMVQRLKNEEMYAEAKKLYESGSYLSSRDLYLNIIKDNPSDHETKRIIGRLNEVLNVVMSIDAQGAVWNYLRKALSNYIAENGNTRAAIASAWYAEQLDPENKVVLAVRDFIERQGITVLRTMEPPVKGMNIIDQYLFAVLTHIYENRYDLAIEKCQIILELQPDNILALKRLGSAYFAMGKKAEAREVWKKALELSPGNKDLEKYIRETN